MNKIQLIAICIVAIFSYMLIDFIVTDVKIMLCEQKIIKQEYCK